MNQPDKHAGRVSILIVDDDLEFRRTLHRLLEGETYHVEEAETAALALSIYERVRPDMVLLDAYLPEIDSANACSRLREAPDSDPIPVLVITNVDDNAAVERAFEAGAIDYVSRPIHWPILRRRIERILSTQQIQRSRDDLLQMVVHDMKNPISVISGFADLLLNDPSEGEWRTEALKRIYDNSTKLLDMTMLILDIGRLEEGKLVPQPSVRPILAVLREVKDSFTWLSKELRIGIEIRDCEPDISAALDWGLIHRVLANLVSNAFKHSLPESTVVLSCAVSTEPDHALLIAVIDQGEGIAPEDQALIFEKFTQASHRTQGSQTDTGLGLTFCKLAVEAHGGTIQLQSELGLGSQFTLVLPYKNEIA